MLLLKRNEAVEAVPQVCLSQLVNPKANYRTHIIKVLYCRSTSDKKIEPEVISVLSGVLSRLEELSYYICLTQFLQVLTFLGLLSSNRDVSAPTSSFRISKLLHDGHDP